MGCARISLAATFLGHRPAGDRCGPEPESRANGKVDGLLSSHPLHNRRRRHCHRRVETARSSGYQIGKTIRVLYDPSQPDKLEIDAFWSRWLMVIGASFLAVVSFGIGAAALLNSQG